MRCEVASVSAKETLIQSQNQISYEFLHIASSTFSLNSSLFAPPCLIALQKNSRMKSDNDLISVSLSRQEGFKRESPFLFLVS